MPQNKEMSDFSELLSVEKENFNLGGYENISLMVMGWDPKQYDFISKT
ncbi:hypothetical protein [Bacillus wiedmannii]|nr:hypothetical protein [Bacillus wiedmannii]